MLDGAGFPLEYGCITNEGNKIIHRQGLLPLGQAMAATFHQRREEDAAFSLAQTRAKLAKLQKKMDMLRAAPGVRTRRSYAQQSEAKAPFLARLGRQMVALHAEAEDWNDVVNKEKTLTRLGLSFRTTAGGW